MMADRVYFGAVLTSGAHMVVSIGGSSQNAGWDQDMAHHGGVGVYHDSVPIGARTGAVVITLKRGLDTIASFTGPSITYTCPNNLQNYNA
jgi:hypothetical protein